MHDLADHRFSVYENEVSVQDDREAQKLFPQPDVGDVSDPQLIKAGQAGDQSR